MSNNNENNNEYNYSNEGECYNEEKLNNNLVNNNIKPNRSAILNSLLTNYRQKSKNIEALNKESESINKKVSNELKELISKNYNTESSTYRREKNRINNSSLSKKTIIREKKKILMDERDKITKRMENIKSNKNFETQLNTCSSRRSDALNYDMIKRGQLNMLLTNHLQKSKNIEALNKESESINTKVSNELKELISKNYNTTSTTYTREKKRINNLNSSKNKITEKKQNLIDERNKISGMMKNIIEYPNENFETLLNTRNSRSIKIKKNEIRMEMLGYIEIFNKKIDNFNKINTKIDKVIRCRGLNDEFKDKEKILIIPDLEILMSDYNSIIEPFEASQFSINLEHFLQKEQIKNKVYNDCIELIEKYKSDLRDNRDKILETLIDSLTVRSFYKNEIDKDIISLHRKMEEYFYVQYEQNVQNIHRVLRESRAIINRIIKIQNYKNISLSYETIDKIYHLDNTFLSYELAHP